MKTYLIDLDGTMYSGNTNIDGAREFIAYLQEKGFPYIFLTNNATRTKTQAKEHMLNLGFKNIKEEDFFTSAIATAKYISKNYSERKCFMLGESGLEEALKEENFIFVEDKADFVVVGLDRKANYTKYSEALHHILAGAKRIGHGIAAKKSEEVVSLIRERNITLEMCPKCNIQTKASKNWNDYPFDTFYRKEKLLVTINTDNRTVSNTSLLQEFELLKKFDILVEVKTPLFLQNINSIDKVYDFCKKNNFKYKVDTQIVPRRGTIGNEVRVKSLTLKQLIPIQKKIDEINGVTFVHKNENFLTCSSVQLSLYITCLGAVQPCSLYSRSIGNIYLTPIREIWNRSAFNKIAKYTLKNSKNCSTCAISNYCTQCPGIALSESGDSRNCSTICKKTALARSIVYADLS